MSLQDILLQPVKQAINTIYGADLETIEFQATRKEFG